MSIWLAYPLTPWISYISVAVIKHNDPNQLVGKLYFASQFQRDKSPSWQGGREMHLPAGTASRVRI